MGFADSYVAHLAEEVIRKLRLATVAETKDDLEIICEELFTDITGLVNAETREKLQLPDAGCFFEVLAPYYLKATDSAEALLHISRKLWHQPYIASIYALLLHRWLLLKKDAGGWEQRQKHLNVLVLGARDVFFGDVLGGRARFRHLFVFLLDSVVLAADRSMILSLPPQSRTSLLELAAAFLPYYTPPHLMADMLTAFPSPAHLSMAGGHHPDGEGADFVLWEVAHLLHRVQSETGMLKFLAALRALAACPHLRSLRPRTSMLLQYELFLLTKPGGPQYVPRAVEALAADTVDCLFPRSRWTRKAVRWAMAMLLVPLNAGTRLYASATRSALALLLSLFVPVRHWLRLWLQRPPARSPSP